MMDYLRAHKELGYKCSWCGFITKPSKDDIFSHGLCKTCKKKMEIDLAYQENERIKNV